MGKIPIYQPSQRLTTESPLAQRNPNAEGQFGRDLQGVGNALTEVGQGIQKVYDLQQTGTAKLKTAKGMAAIEEESAQDGNNTGNFTPYRDKINQLKTDALQEISTPAAKARFEEDFDMAAIATETRIKRGFMENVKAKSIANIDELGKITIEQYPTDPEALKTYYKNVDIYEGAGVINADDALKLKDKITSDAQTYAFEIAYRKNPTEAEKALKANSWGMNIETLTKAEGKLKSLQNEVREQQKNNAYDMWERLHAGTLTIQEIVSAKDSGGIDGIGKPEAKNLETSLYERLNKRVESLYTSQDRARQYIDVVKNIENDREKYSRFQTILASFADGSLSQEESTTLNNLVGKKESDFDLIKSGVKAIKNWAASVPNLSMMILAPALNNYFNKVANAEEPKQAAKKAIEQATIEHNPDKTKYEVGEIITNPKTRRSAKVTGFKPDGTPILQAQ